jgi:hypothetical protein
VCIGKQCWVHTRTHAARVTAATASYTRKQCELRPLREHAVPLAGSDSLSRCRWRGMCAVMDRTEHVELAAQHPLHHVGEHTLERPHNRSLQLLTLCKVQRGPLDVVGNGRVVPVMERVPALGAHTVEEGHHFRPLA